MDNPYNKLITKEKIEEILNSPKNLGGKLEKPEYLYINDVSNYQKAFVHESYIQSVKAEEQKQIVLNYTPNEDYNRLEFLGDNQLKASQASYIFERYPDNNQGFYTLLKIKLEQCSMLSSLAKSLGFTEYILLSSSIEQQTVLAHDIGRNTPSYHEDVFEAFIGAIIMDFGEMGKVYADRFIRNTLEERIDFAYLNATDLNYKHILQKYYQANQWDNPSYIALKESLDENMEYKRIYPRVLVMNKRIMLNQSVTIQKRIHDYNNKILARYKHDIKINGLLDRYQKNGYIIGIGYGRRIIHSEQECAKIALSNLEKLTCNLNLQL